MPELPEVETAANDLNGLLAGACFDGGVWTDWPKALGGLAPEALGRAIAGRGIARVFRRAKWIVVALSDGSALGLHLRMSGSVSVSSAASAPGPHVHVGLGLEDGRRLDFRDVRKFGRLLYLDPAAQAALFARYGPEPLAPDFTPEALAGRFAGRRGALKPLLLNQAVVAGLGNIYVDEALFRAGLHPLRSAARVSRREWTRLHAAIRRVLTDAIARKGTTLRDYRTGTGERGENQRHLAVYGREGEPCARCETPISRIEVGQRGTHFCLKCQK